MFDRAQRRADRALTPPQVGPWNRRRLIAVFAAAVTGCALVLLGLGLAVYYTLESGAWWFDDRYLGGRGQQWHRQQDGRQTTWALAHVRRECTMGGFESGTLGRIPK